MKFIADLHIHSKYSIATSKTMEPESLYKASQIKGVQLIGTGDFTHPGWITELQEKLEPAEQGVFRLRPELAKQISVEKSCQAEVRFLLTSEISCVYKKDGQTRKVHNLMMVPDFATALKIQAALAKRGNIAYDGRPIIGIDSKELLDIALTAHPDTIFVPAHIWTPHFAVLGSKSGFDSLEACFDDLLPHIFAVETGLSSDPAMNWRLSQLDKVKLLSNSDCHSPDKIGRNANLFDTDMSFNGIRQALTGEDPTGFLGTLDFFPEEGKYHYDGHRPCNRSCSPQESIKHNYLCPDCGKKLTLGVLHRVEALADRQPGEQPAEARPFESLVPLKEIISAVVGVGPTSKRVANLYNPLIAALGNELSILRKKPLTAIATASNQEIAQAVQKVREGKVRLTPGYDGVYGQVKI